jgi:hypothetical protein
MEFYFKMKTIKEKVRSLIASENTSHLRDSDEKLIATIYYLEIGPDMIKNMSAMEFLHYYSSGRLPSAESIRRLRQSLQEKEPELRGKLYNERKSQEHTVRAGIKNL